MDVRTPLVWFVAAFVCAGAGCARDRYVRTPFCRLWLTSNSRLPRGRRRRYASRLHQHTREAAPSARGNQQEPAPEYAGLVSTYCVTCHNDRLKTAGLSLQSLGLANVPEHAQVWEKVAQKLRTGEMPPSTVRSRPDPQTANALLTYLETTLDRAAVAHPNPGRPPVHRLNRAEYSNAIRDLLAVDVRPGEWLPVDDSGYGFDNIAAVLSTSPALLDRYMSAARKVSRLAVGDLTLKPVEEIYDAKRDPVKGTRNEQLNDDLPFDSRAGMTVEHYFPLDAEYVFKVRFLGVQPGAEETEPDPYQVRVAVKAGLHTVGVTSPRENLKAESDTPPGGPGGAPAGRGSVTQVPSPVDLRLSGARLKRFDVPDTKPEVTKLIIGGPYKPTGRGETPSRRTIFVCRPARPAQEPACARTILKTLAHRAFRRPVTSDDIEPLYAVLPEGPRRTGDFESGIQAAIEAMLVSPEFLFRIERDPPTADARHGVIASATSSSRRACRSSCGAPFPTRSCSTWPNAAG